MKIDIFVLTLLCTVYLRFADCSTSEQPSKGDERVRKRGEFPHRPPEWENTKAGDSSVFMQIQRDPYYKSIVDIRRKAGQEVPTTNPNWHMELIDDKVHKISYIYHQINPQEVEAITPTTKEYLKIINEQRAAANLENLKPKYRTPGPIPYDKKAAKPW